MPKKVRTPGGTAQTTVKQKGRSVRYWSSAGTQELRVSDMHSYPISLCILGLGLWSIIALLLYDPLKLYLTHDFSSASQLHPLALALGVLSNMIPGILIVASPSAVFAALLYPIASRYEQPACQYAVLLSSIAFAVISVGCTLLRALDGSGPIDTDMLFFFGGPILMASYFQTLTWRDFIATPFALQTAMIPALSAICFFVGRSTRSKSCPVDAPSDP